MKRYRIILTVVTDASIDVVREVAGHAFVQLETFADFGANVSTSACVIEGPITLPDPNVRERPCSHRDADPSEDCPTCERLQEIEDAALDVHE